MHMERLSTPTVIFLAILLIVTGAFFFIMKPFVYAIFWAVILAGLFMPVYKKIEKKALPANDKRDDCFVFDLPCVSSSFRLYF